MPHEQKYPKVLRFQWYQSVERHHWSVTDTCDFFRIPRKTYYAWYPQDHGGRSPVYHNPQPHPNTKLTESVKDLIYRTKLKTNYGPIKMSLFLERTIGLIVSHTPIQRFYVKKHLIRKPQKKLPWYQPMTKKLVIARPGEGVQMDVKYVYVNGARQYQFSVLDHFTEKYHCTIFPTRESRNAIKAFKLAQTYLSFAIQSVQTDNGSEFRGQFHDWLTTNNIPHYFIPKHSPYWNAQVERIHKTVDDEYYHNPLRPWHTLAEWLTYYNYERLHLSLDGLTPQEKYLKSVTLEC